MSRRAAGRRLAAGLIVLALLLSSCFDMRELNQLALVMAVGIDKSPEDPARFVVTIQIARPGATGEGRGGSAGGEAPVFTASADGDTIFAAIRNLAQFTSRRIMWAHNNVVIIGRSLAEEDITPVIDFFTRNQELRLRTWVVVARDAPARDLVTAKTGMEDIPANSISALFRYAALPGESVRTDMAALTAAFFSADLNPVISAMRLTERAIPIADRPGEHGGNLEAELRGTAIIQGKRLVGFVEEDAGRGLLWLRGEMRNATVTIPCPGPTGKSMAVEIRGPQVKVHAQIRQGKPHFRVAVQSQGWLTEQGCTTPQYDTMSLKAYAEEHFARQVEEQIREALRVLQEDLRTDAIKFGNKLHAQQPGWWRQNQDRWSEIFPEVPVEVSVTTDLPKMGLYNRPMNFNVR